MPVAGVRSRESLRPTSPQHEAGMRTEPPPSLACAIGTTPAATAAAAPPDEPAARKLGVPRIARGAAENGFGRRRQSDSGVVDLPSETMPVESTASA